MSYVAGFGNPLLDITVKINNDEILRKHHLNEDGQKEISASEMISLYKDISKYSNQISAGGSAQNTVRVLQWLLNKPNSTVYFGGIGDDEQGRILTKLVQQANVSTRYQINPHQPTGTCIALVKGCYRSLVANLGAAEYFDNSLLHSEESQNILKTVKLIYMEGFFITKRQVAANYVKNFSLEHNTVFAFNLCAPYLCDLYPEHIEEFAKSCQILFGNKKEFEALGKLLNIEDHKDVAVMLNKTFSLSTNINNKELLRFGKIIVVTNGCRNVLCVHSEAKIVEMEVPTINPADIGDTTGAGDSFVAGFLAALLQGKDINTCLRWACWSASQIIQQIGCTIPNYAPEIYLRNI